MLAMLIFLQCISVVVTFFQEVIKRTFVGLRTS